MPLDELWGAAAKRLTDRATQSPGVGGVARALSDAIGERMCTTESPDPLSVPLVRALRRGLGVRELADAMGFSERQLRRRSMDAFGYGPKTLQRILRFKHAVGLASLEPSFAAVAAAAGYADQAHLAREVKELAGVSLGQLVSRP